MPVEEYFERCLIRYLTAPAGSKGEKIWRERCEFWWAYMENRREHAN